MLTYCAGAIQSHTLQGEATGTRQAWQLGCRRRLQKCVAQIQDILHLQTLCCVQHHLNVVLVKVEARCVHEVQDLPYAADVCNVQVKDVILLAGSVLKQAPDKERTLQLLSQSANFFF